MKYSLLLPIVALLFIANTLTAQSLTKAELKAQQRAERAEARRIRDSIQTAEYEAEMQHYREMEQRRNANTLIVETTCATREQAYSIIMNALLDSGYLIADKDKEFYTLTTEKKDAGMARYDLSFRVKEQEGKIYAEISGRSHVIFTLYGVTHQSASPLENKGTEGSVNKVGFAEMERFASLLPNTNIQYITR